MYKTMLHYFTRDKILHFLFGCAISIPFITVAGIFGKSIILTSIIVTCIVGVGKEVFDIIDNKFGGGQNSIKFLDIVATILGGLYAGILIELVR
jgi:hypothetical protein